MRYISYYSEVKDPAVDWVFSFLSTAIGCKFYSVPEVDLASVVYADMPVNANQLQIPTWTGYYDNTQKHSFHSGGYWMPDNVREIVSNIDFIGLIFRLLTLADEIALPNEARDRLGNLSTNIEFPRLEGSDRPLVDIAIHKLKQQLIKSGLLKEDELLPLWPAGKRYAVLITHDTDGPCLLETRELAKAGIKGFVILFQERSCMLK